MTSKDVKMETFKININNIKQLIPINADMINFKIDFYIKSDDGKKFECLVIDQNTLDEKENLEYNLVDKGEISGQVISDRNVRQNWFILLKSEEPCSVTLRLESQQFPDFIPLKDDIKTVADLQQQHPTEERSWFPFIILGIIILGMLYFVLFNSTSSSTTTSSAAFSSPTVNLPTPSLFSEVADRLKAMKTN